MAVNDECKLKFVELKTKRIYRFIIFKIHCQKSRRALITDEHPPRPPLYPPLITDEHCQKSKIFFIAWSPDTSRESKMVYASSKDRFKRELDGIQVELQATDPSEMSLDIVKARAL
ncbi:unnamed protein product [Rhodiola kirilowii]